MITEYQLRMMAQDTYAQARASNNPLAKRKLLSLADDYLRQADELLGRRITQAGFWKPDSVKTLKA
jgi:hypothetical protein